MLERKQQLAFRMDKIYFLKRHSNEVYKHLQKSREQLWGGEGEDDDGGEAKPISE
jgi:uncharacterized pyridoxamine 5'-phosphate oxidase family protein